MATRVADLAVAPVRVMLDTNVLIAATDEGRAEHHDALTVVNDWAAGNTELCTSGQVLREYLAVATRPVAMNGLGLNLPDALGNVSAIRERTTLLAEDAKVADRLVGRLGALEIRRHHGHDANLVATMLVYGIRTIVTMSIADFARFAGHVATIRL
jgi:predicted nucleic acid-binding protein